MPLVPHLRPHSILYYDMLSSCACYLAPILTWWNSLLHLYCHIKCAWHDHHPLVLLTFWASISSADKSRYMSSLQWTLDENALSSTVFYLLLYHNIGVQSMKIAYLVCDLLFFLFAAWDVSTNAVVMTGLPLEIGILWCISSSAPLYCSWNSSRLVVNLP